MSWKCHRHISWPTNGIKRISKLTDTLYNGKQSNQGPVVQKLIGLLANVMLIFFIEKKNKKKKKTHTHTQKNNNKKTKQKKNKTL